MLLINNVPLKKEDEIKLLMQINGSKPKKGDKPWEFRETNYGLRVTSDPDEKRLIASGTYTVPTVCMIKDPLDTASLGYIEWKYVQGQVTFDKDKQPIEKVTEITFKNGKVLIQPHEIDKYIYMKLADYNGEKEGRAAERAALYYEYNESKAISKNASKMIEQAKIITELQSMSNDDRISLAASVGIDTDDDGLMLNELVLYATANPISFSAASVDPFVKYKSLIKQAHGSDVLSFIEETTSWGYSSPGGVEPIFRVPQGSDKFDSFAAYLKDNMNITKKINDLLKKKDKGK